MATKPIFEILSGVTAGNGGAKKFLGKGFPPFVVYD
jgi:hypothetical protein